MSVRDKPFIRLINHLLNEPANLYGFAILLMVAKMHLFIEIPIALLYEESYHYCSHLFGNYTIKSCTPAPKIRNLRVASVESIHVVCMFCTAPPREGQRVEELKA
jgi:hypothetical protein